jgi:hypothetical protein
LNLQGASDFQQWKQCASTHPDQHSTNISDVYLFEVGKKLDILCTLPSPCPTTQSTARRTRKGQDGADFFNANAKDGDGNGGGCSDKFSFHTGDRLLPVPPAVQYWLEGGSAVGDGGELQTAKAVAAAKWLVAAAEGAPNDQEVMAAERRLLNCASFTSNLKLFKVYGNLETGKHIFVDFGEACTFIGNVWDVVLQLVELCSTFRSF